MAVVTHHPVVVELEGVALRLLAVDEDAASIVYLQVVALVNLDAALVYRQILQRQRIFCICLWLFFLCLCYILYDC